MSYSIKLFFTGVIWVVISWSFCNCPWLPP